MWAVQVECLKDFLQPFCTTLGMYIKSFINIVKVSIFLCSPCLGADGLTLYVSPQGDDSHVGSLERPLRTIHKAQDLVRTHLQSNEPKTDTTVYLMEGTYTQAEPIIFKPEDSGTQNAKVKYVAFDGKKVIISGGKVIAGQWEKVEGKEYYQIKIPEAAAGDWIFNNLYVNGGSRERARIPNYNEPAYRADGFGEFLPPKTSIKYFPGQFDPEWTDIDNIDVVMLMTWTPVMHSIKNVYPEQNVIELQSSEGAHQLYWFLHNQYFLANVYEALDYPGEWYFNRKTGVLSYYPMPGENMEEIQVIAPVVVGPLIKIEGDVSQNEFVEYIEFHGIHFSHTDTDRWKHNGVYRQGHGFLGGAVTAKGLRHSVFSKCVFSQLADYAIELNAGSSHNLIIQSHITDIGAGGILIGEADLSSVLAYREQSAVYDYREAGFSEDQIVAMEDKRTHYKSDVMFNTIENNIINRIGTYWLGGYGINNRFASYTKIVHNEIFDTHWDPIALDARWGHQGGYQGENYAHGNEIAYNYIHDVGRGYFADAGAIYQFGPNDTYIHHNVIRDTYSWQERVGFKGIYLDQQSREAVVENNLLYNIDGVGLNQHWGLNNTFQNNIVAFAQHGLSDRGSPNEYFDNINSMFVLRNIYISKDGKMQYKRFSGGGLEHSRLERNLYYDIHGTEPVFWEGLSFEEYKKETGYDEGSIIADPGMKDPENFNFEIPERNDALKSIGFQRFDEEIAKAGIYGDSTWTELPSQLEIRAKVPQYPSEKFFQYRQNFHDDFELQLPGRSPLRYRPRADKDAGQSVEISADQAFSGKHSLAFIDKAGASKGSNPSMLVSMEWTPVDLTRKELHFSFKAMNHASSPIPFRLFSDGTRHGDEPGLSIEFSPDGSLTANGQTILKTTVGAWVGITIEMGLGIPSGMYQLTVTENGNSTIVTLPLETAHEELIYLTFEAPESVDGTFYLDDITMRVR